MTYAEASATVQEYTQSPLLESLQRLKTILELEDMDAVEEAQKMPTKVKVAYYQLMAGFTEMFG